MKKNTIVILTIFLFVCLFVYWFYSIDQRSKAKNTEIEAFIDNCVDSGGRIDEIGNGITASHRLICYPKD